MVEYLFFSITSGIAEGIFVFPEKNWFRKSKNPGDFGGSKTSRRELNQAPKFAQFR